jgi:hypothetical protein
MSGAATGRRPGLVPRAADRIPTNGSAAVPYSHQKDAS